MHARTMSDPQKPGGAMVGTRVEPVPKNDVKQARDVPDNRLRVNEVVRVISSLFAL